MPEESADLDRRLKELAIVAREHPAKSRQRRLALNQLCAELLKPGRLVVPAVPSEFDRREIYQEALSLTLLEICQKIDSYNSQKEVRQWCNFLLKKRQADAITKYRKQGLTSVPRRVSNSSDASFDSPRDRGDRGNFLGVSAPEDLENILSSEETRSNSRELRQFIEEDPDGIFSREHVRDRPDANLKFLAIAHIWEDRTWSEISEELQLPIQTIYGLFKKKMPNFYPLFREYLRQ